MGAGSSFTVSDLYLALLIGAVVLLVAAAAVRLSFRSGLPSLLLYLGIGLSIGEGGLLHIPFESAHLTQLLGYTALVLILAEGGLTTNWQGIRYSVAPAAVLSTVGVAVSIFVTGTAAKLILDVSWNTALLLGAILASTDAAAVFSVLRLVPLPRRLTGMLEAESGFNDAPVVIVVVALATASFDPMPWWQLVLLAGWELAGGTAVGLAVGFGGGWLARRVGSPSSGLFSIVIVALTVLAYASAALLHLSGFIAVYLCALVLGNLRLPYQSAVRGFAQALGWLAQIGLFVLLGLLASPSELYRWAVPALLIGLVLLLVARPLSVFLSMAPFRLTRLRLSVRDQLFLSWAGLRGAVPVVLATVPLTLGTADVDWLFDLVFVLVVVFTLIQAPTLPWVARRLGVTESEHAVGLDVESTPLDELKADLLQVQIGPASKLHGVEVFELRLPVGASVTLVVRNGTGFVPLQSTVLRHGDQLLVVATADVKAAAERRVREVSEYGRLAGWK